MNIFIVTNTFLCLFNVSTSPVAENNGFIFKIEEEYPVKVLYIDTNMYGECVPMITHIYFSHMKA